MYNVLVVDNSYFLTPIALEKKRKQYIDEWPSLSILMIVMVHIGMENTMFDLGYLKN